MLLIRFYNLIICCFASSYLLTQNTGTIQGIVVSGSDTLTGALVTLDQRLAATADAGGKYAIAAPAGEYQLDCRLTGYDPFKQKVIIRENETISLNIVLRENTNPLDEIVVSTERYGQKLGEVTVSTEVIKPALIENKNFTTLDDVMNQVPGVVVMDGQASIRGGSGFSYGAGSRVLMLVDEIPMISADAADVKWNYIPIENLEQVEVVKGAASVLYGSGALNGVVNLRTAFARSEPRTQLQMYYGGYEAPRKTYKWWNGSLQSQQGVNLSHAQKIGNLDLVVGAHKFSDDGYRMLETETRDRLNANLRYRFSKVPQLNVGANVNMMNTKGGLFFLWKHYDTAYVPAGNDIQRYNNNRFNIDPWISWSAGGDTAGGYKISARTRYFKTQNANDKGQGSYAELYYGELQYLHFFRKMNLAAGLVRMDQTVLGDSLYGVHKGRNLAAYAQVTGHWINRLTLTAGIRAEHFKVDSVETVGYLMNRPGGGSLPFQPVVRVGANYRLAAQTYLRASCGQGYRFPSVAEKYVNTSVSVLRIFPNPDLRPERALSAELSVKQGFAIGGFRGYADLATFYTRYRDMIEFVFDVFRPGGASGNFFEDFNWAGFKSQNVSNAQITGAELSVNAAGNFGPVMLSVFAGYTYIDPIQPGFDPARDTLGLPGVKTLKYRSRHLAKGDVQLSYKKWSLGYSARYQSRNENIDRRFVRSVFEEYSGSTGIDFSQVASSYILPGLRENYSEYSKSYLVQDARVSFQLSKQVRLSFIVNNFMNVEYQTRPGDVAAPTMYVGQVLIKI